MSNNNRFSNKEMSNNITITIGDYMVYIYDSKEGERKGICPGVATFGYNLFYNGDMFATGRADNRDYMGYVNYWHNPVKGVSKIRVVELVRNLNAELWNFCITDINQRNHISFMNILAYGSRLCALDNHNVPCYDLEEKEVGMEGFIRAIIDHFIWYVEL